MIITTALFQYAGVVKIMPQNEKQISINCPVCNQGQKITIPAAMLSKENGIADIQIKGVCGHNYDIYIDNNFKVRGYHRPDFVLISHLAEVDRKLSTIIQDDSELGSTITAEIKNYKNYFDSNQNLDDIKLFLDTESYVDIYSRTKLLGIVQVPGSDDSEMVFTPISKVPESDRVSKVDPAQMETIKLEYDMRIQKIRALLTDSTRGATEKAKLLDIKKDLDDYYKSVFNI
jgi:hypothetical protein